MGEDKFGYLERFGDGDHRDLCARIRVLQAQVAELEHSQLKRENNVLRKALAETDKQYVAVVNENLALVRKLEENGIYWHG